jgi:hypothetical protein
MQPIAIGRVLDDGTTQLSQFSYDTAGYFNRIQAVDAVGRTTSLAYANHVDLSAISQTVAFGVQQTVASPTAPSIGHFSTRTPRAKRQLTPTTPQAS